MEIKLGIMKKGDKVLNAWDNKVAIKKKNGEVEIFEILYPENEVPRISEKSIVITFGEKTLSMKKDETSKIELGTF